MWSRQNVMLFRAAKQVNEKSMTFTRLFCKSLNNYKISLAIKNNSVFHSNWITHIVGSSEKNYITQTKCQLCSNAITVSKQSEKAEIINYNVILKPETKSTSTELELENKDIPRLPSALEACKEDISHFGPYFSPSYNLAKYANKSQTIQKLVKLGVRLYQIEKDVELMEFYLTRDFNRDIAPYITFLHDCGVPADFLGEFISKNPLIFKNDMDDLHTRIRYLRFHKFSSDMIKIILCKQPKWLSYSTSEIDSRLGYFQNTFHLNGHEVRLLTTIKPTVITAKMKHIRENTFSIREEMGFNKKETKTLLLKSPALWIKSRKNIVDTFDYAHNQMQLSHSAIVEQPYILKCRKSRLKERHTFLVKLNRAQYDPTKPLYVSPKALVSGSDVDFCRDVAKVNIETYNLYLKTF